MHEVDQVGGQLVDLTIDRASLGDDVVPLLAQHLLGRWAGLRHVRAGRVRGALIPAELVDAGLLEGVAPGGRGQAGQPSGAIAAEQDARNEQHTGQADDESSGHGGSPEVGWCPPDRTALTERAPPRP